MDKKVKTAILEIVFGIVFSLTFGLIGLMHGNYLHGVKVCFMLIGGLLVVAGILSLFGLFRDVETICAAILWYGTIAIGTVLSSAWTGSKLIPYILSFVICFLICFPISRFYCEAKQKYGKK